MSGFEDNFQDGLDDNPFKDPSIAEVTSHAARIPVLDDYDPFKENYEASPATLRPSAEEVSAPPPQYNKSGQQQVQPRELQDFERRQIELDKKAADLARREEELKQQTTYNARRNNWPPLPDSFCVQPCFYQDINVEIPFEFQRLVRHLYYLWMFHGIALCLNVVGGLTLLIAVNDFTTFGVGILYLLLFTPFSFLCWYRPIYKAFRSDSSFNFMVFFFVFFFQFVVTAVQAIGLPGSGTCGILKAIYCFKVGGVFSGIIVLVIALLFIACAVGELLLLSKVHTIYRSSGASFAKAQQEFTSEFLRNEHVQDAATNAATATLRSQMSSQGNRR